MRQSCFITFLVYAFLIRACSISLAEERQIPIAPDKRLVVEKFASAPQIVQPIGLTFDAKGRLLIIESHTHFRPPNYQGPKFDRVRIVLDPLSAAKAEQIETYFEGTTATMDIEGHPDGSVYLSSRNEILRLRDYDGDGKAESKQRIVFLDTKGDYPHNGLSGLCFDFEGNLFFGLGENLGAAYKLIGSDGTTLTGEGDGGSIFWCTKDGKNLRRVARGFWNPFSVCRDVYGRLFAVDNDPDSSPPCRLLHIVEGGDYGYQFRYGRSGRHVFQSWNGQLAGTLPMICGTGEAPCEVLPYESDGLPEDYRGKLLVSAWADHQIESYELKPNGVSFQATRNILLKGDASFHPVGIAVAPDGSLFVSDWSSVSYELHGKGAIWHIRQAAPPATNHQTGTAHWLSKHRPLREASARKLAQSADGRNTLRELLCHMDPAIRATCISALVEVKDPQFAIDEYRKTETNSDVDDLVRKCIVRLGMDVRKRFDASFKQVGPSKENYFELGGLTESADARRLLQALAASDPWYYSAIIDRLSRNAGALEQIAASLPARDPRVQSGILLAMANSGNPQWRKSVPIFLSDSDEQVRFLAVKWISDYKFTEHKTLIENGLRDPQLSSRMVSAYATALARLEGREPTDSALQDYFVARLNDPRQSPETIVNGLKQVSANHKKLTLAVLDRLLERKQPAVTQEVVWILAEHPDVGRLERLFNVAKDVQAPVSLRADAIAGLSPYANRLKYDFINLASNAEETLKQEVVRAMIHVKLEKEDAKTLQSSGTMKIPTRPSKRDTQDWLARLAGPADATKGRRIFFHPNAGGCYRCHRIDGRGSDVGPDLSQIGHVDRDKILVSILRPNDTVAPHYQSWQIALTDGQVRSGQLVKTYLDETTYVDANGTAFKVKATDVAELRATTTSIMPDNLVDSLSDQEIRDLLAYLCSRQ